MMKILSKILLKFLELMNHNFIFIDNIKVDLLKP